MQYNLFFCNFLSKGSIFTKNILTMDNLSTYSNSGVPPISNLSIIVPVYNVENYLADCIDSLLKIQIDKVEIILIDDGSTDSSGKIADKYASQNNKIKVIHQTNGGLATARNRGMTEAKGEYIAFVDSDDWILDRCLEKIYQECVTQKADLIMGNTLFIQPDGKRYNPFNPIPSDICHSVLSGKDCFSELMKSGTYPPMVYNFLYRRAWLEKQKLYFEDVVHEDELWTPQAFCLAEHVYITNIDFYGYRQREGSIMNTLKKVKRIQDLIYISNRLIHFASAYSFNSPDREVKSQLYVKVYMLYNIAFTTLSSIKNGDFTLPTHALYTIFKIKNLLSPLAGKRVYHYYKNAQKGLKSFRKWKTSPWVSQLFPEAIKNKHIILIYNTMWDAPLNIPIDQIPNNYVFTTDRNYLALAKTVIFHLPTLINELEGDLDKPEGQLWVAWIWECEENYPFIKDPEFMNLFDYRISYHQEADVMLFPLSPHSINQLKQPVDIQLKTADICMLISSPVNQSHRLEYLKELMQEIPIDSYGRLYNNKKLEHDNGKEAKINLYKQYKFIIAFENACATDYVTEKFFDPLIAGTVPIYLGAPNIGEFSPGAHCFIHVNDFKSPKELADYLKFCCNNSAEYQSFFEWKKKDLQPSFTQKIQLQDIPPFIRICHILDKR